MSEALEISKYHQSFVETLGSRSVNDFKKTTSDTIKTKYKYFKTRRSITSESTTLGAEHVFSIQSSYGYVGDWYIEITSDDSAAWDIGSGGACNCIKSVVVEFDNGNLSYTGDDLFKMIHLVNRDDKVRTDLVALMGSGDVNAVPMITPILVPGQNLIYGLDAFDQRQPKWCIGAMNKPLVIRITLQTGAYISKTNAFVMASLKLRFNSFSLQNDQIANKRATRANALYYTWYFMKPMSTQYSRTLTDATEDSFTIDNTITQGMLNTIVVDVLDKTTHVADMEYQKTEPIDALALKVRGTEILYEHDSLPESKLRCLLDWKVPNKYNSSASDLGYVFPMSLTGRADLSIQNIGTKGLNLNLNKPTIFLTCTSLTNSATSHLVRVLALYKCLYSIKQDKNTEYRIHP